MLEILQGSKARLPVASPVEGKPALKGTIVDGFSVHVLEKVPIPCDRASQ